METKMISTILASQYKASLGMLRNALEKIPDAQWNTEEYNNPNWQIGYHILWATKFYLGPDTRQYTPFKNAIEGAESLGGANEWENAEVKVEGFHTRAELLFFIDELENTLPAAIEKIPLEGDSGFEWYPYSRLELHINNIRHIQHHTAHPRAWPRRSRRPCRRRTRCSALQRYFGLQARTQQSARDPSNIGARHTIKPCVVEHASDAGLAQKQ